MDTLSVPMVGIELTLIAEYDFEAARLRTLSKIYRVFVLRQVADRLF
jgi:hypothetical protein